MNQISRGNEIWQSSCQPCHSKNKGAIFPNQEKLLPTTTVSDLRKFSEVELVKKLKYIKEDSFHIKLPYHIDQLSDDQIQYITLWIIESGKPVP